MTVQAGPDPVRSVVERAGMLMEVGRDEAALGETVTALAEHPDDPRLHLTAAWLCLHLERSGEARSYAERAVGLAPDASTAHLLLSGALYGLGETHRAREAVEQSLALNPDDANAHSHHARVLLAGRARSADKHLARAASDRSLELAPDDPAVLLQAAGIREELGDTDGRRELILRGLAIAPADEDLLVAQARLSDGTGSLGGVLAGNPMHTDARLLLHLRVWQQLSGLADHLVLVGTFALLAVGWVMSDRGIVFAPFWGIALLLALGVGLVRRVRRLSGAPRAYVVRALGADGGRAHAGTVLLVLALVGVLLVVLSLFVVADAVSARHLVVLGAVVVLLAGVSSAFLTPAVLDVGRDEGLFPDSREGTEWFARQLHKTRIALVARAVIVVVVAVLVAATLPLAGRSDALGVALLGGAMYMLPVVAGWWSIDRTLRARSAPPRPVLGVPARALLVASAVVVLLVGAAGLVQVPVVAGVHDRHGPYVTPPFVVDDGPAPCGSSTGVPCSGVQVPLRDFPVDPPTYDIPDLDLEFDLPPLVPGGGDVPPPPLDPVPDRDVPVTVP